MADTPLPDEEYTEVGNNDDVIVNSTQLPSIDSLAFEEIIRNFYEGFNNQKQYVLIGLYVPVIVIAVTANILVIVVVFKNHYMRSVTNYFVVNLSVADLLVTTLCMPMAISQAVSITWLYNEIMCKLFFYLQGVAVAASVFTITAMSVDRYLAIKSPIAFRRIFNRKSTIIIIVAVWSLSLAIFMPVLSSVRLKNFNQENITLILTWNGKEPMLHNIRPPSIQVCFEDFASLGIPDYLFGTTCFILVYAIPGFIVVVTYSLMGRTLCSRKPPFDGDSIEGSASSQQGLRLVRERRRVAWILLILAILFTLCWLPYNVMTLLIDFGAIDNDKVVGKVLAYCLFLGHSNSALNPVVYCFMTRNFRRCVSEILCKNCQGIAKRNPRHRTLLAGGVRARTGSPGIGQHRVLQCQRMMRGSTALSGVLTQPALWRSFTASTRCNSYDRHSPHRQCYMLKSQLVRKDIRNNLNAETRLDNISAAPVRAQSLHNVVINVHEQMRVPDDIDNDECENFCGNSHRHSN